MQCPHACIYCMHTKYYQAISKIPKFLLGVNVSWICLSLKRKFWKQMFIYIVCHNNVVKSFLKLYFYFLIGICIFARFFLFLNYFCYDCMNEWSDSLYYLPNHSVEVAGLFNLLVLIAEAVQQSW